MPVREVVPSGSFEEGAVQVGFPSPGIAREVVGSARDHVLVIPSVIVERIEGASLLIQDG